MTASVIAEAYFMVKKNYLGEVITGRKEFLKSSFGYYDENGDEHVNWKPEDDTVDSDGFDKRACGDGTDYVQDIVLPYGKLICRYGNVRGRMTTDADADYNCLGLPYVKETVEYHLYKVIANGITVRCIVMKGKVAPMFDSPGGAVQYKHYQSIAQELYSGKLEEVYL